MKRIHRERLPEQQGFATFRTAIKAAVADAWVSANVHGWSSPHTEQGSYDIWFHPSTLRWRMHRAQDGQQDMPGWTFLGRLAPEDTQRLQRAADTHDDGADSAAWERIETEILARWEIGDQHRSEEE